MGPRYVESITETVEMLFKETDASTPLIYLLSAGADPTDSIDTLARKKRKDIECISMGEGQVGHTNMMRLSDILNTSNGDADGVI